MPIPELNEDGHLPPGVYDCTLAELRSAFAPWHHTPRGALMQNLEHYLQEAAGSLILWVAVDGSFTTRTSEPNDIDLVVVLPPDHDFSVPVRPHEENLINRPRVLRRYQDTLDIRAVAEGDRTYQDRMNFFQHTRDGNPKGILRVRP